MNNRLDLQQTNIKKLFFNYLFPAISAGLVTALYIIVDGIFVGKGIGSQGIASVGIVSPMFTLFTGMSLIFGLGGSIQSAIAGAQNKRILANKFFTQSVVGIIVLMALFTFGILSFKGQILKVFGAEGEIFFLSQTYLSIMILFSIPFTLALVLAFFVRVDGYPKLAMIATVSGAVTNIILDYLFIFVFKMGIFGAGLATGIGNILASVMMIIHFTKRNKSGLKFHRSHFDFTLYKKIALIGFPSFTDQILISLIIIVFNRRLFEIAGPVGVSALSLVAYLIPFLVMLFNGVSQATQPIVSSNFGSGKIDRVKEATNVALRTALGIGILIAIIGFTLNDSIASLFLDSSEEAYQKAVGIIPFFFSSYLFAGTTIVFQVYFQSTARPGFSLVLSVLRGGLIIIPLMYLLSSIFGMDGMWWALLISEAMTMFIGLIFYLKKKNFQNECLSALEYKCHSA